MKVVVFGATGVVGRAAAEHFATIADGGVVGVSRRPVDVPGVTHLAVDLADPVASAHALRDPSVAGVTHVVYAALQESPQLAHGWRDRELMERNLVMFRHALEPLAAHGSLEHVSVLQGAKAYGFHVGRAPVPAKEDRARDDHANFYFLQEDLLRDLAAAAPWSFTVLRPQVVFGESLASPMNLLPAIGVYAAVERARGNALSFPGGDRTVQEAVDARLLARVLGWAARAPGARDEVFNVTNGDVFAWHDVWPSIADALGMDVGEPSPRRLADEMPPRAGEWAGVVDRFGLRAPSDMAAFVGDSWQYADILFGASGTRAIPALLSTVKLRQAGFAECLDTEAMFRDWFACFQRDGLLPPP